MRPARMVGDLQRWYWSGYPGPSRPRIDAFLAETARLAGQISSPPGPLVTGAWARIEDNPRPGARDTAGSIALILLAPRGLGLKRQLAVGALAGMQEAIGPKTSAQQIARYTLRHPTTILRGLGARRLVLEPVRIDTNAVPIGPSEEWSAVLLPPDAFVGAGLGRDESRRLADAVSTLHALTTWAPESTLRYAEQRGLDHRLRPVLATFGLDAPYGRLGQLMDARRAVAATRIPGASAGSVQPVVVHDLAGQTADRWADEGVSPLVRLEDAVVLGGYLPTQGGRIIVLDDTADPRRRAVAGQSRLAVCGSRHSSAALVAEPTEGVIDLPQGMLLAGRADHNWYHFLADTLPRLRHLDEVDDTVPLLVSDLTPRTGIDLLARLTARPVVQLRPDTAYRVGRLTAVGGRASLPDTKESPAELAPRYDEAGIRWLRDRVAALDIPAARPCEILVVERPSGLRQVRGRRLLDALPALRGATRLDPASAGLDAQLAAYRSCSVMVVPGGAALINMLFTRPDTVTIGLVGRVRPARPLWNDLAAVAERQYIRIPLRVAPSFGTAKPSHHRDVLVTPASAWRLANVIGSAGVRGHVH